MFSVIVPVRADAPGLVPLLDALAAQDLPRERFEVVLALEGAGLPDGLAARVAGLGGQTLPLAAGRGPGPGRNAAAALARFEWLAFTGDDCVPAPDWLARAAGRIARAPAPDVILGAVARTGADEGSPCDAANLFVHRERFVRVRGFHDGYFGGTWEEAPHAAADFAFALEETNAVIVQEESLVVIRPRGREGFWEPLRWAARHRHDALLARRHPLLFNERFDVHQLGPLRVRRPIVRACTGVVLALAFAAGLILAGRGPQAVPLLAIAVMLELVVWSRWRFHPLRLLPVLLVPFVLAAALVRGQMRAARRQGR